MKNLKPYWLHKCQYEFLKLAENLLIKFAKVNSTKIYNNE